MKKVFLFIAFLTVTVTQAQQSDHTMKLWYLSPAENWNEALPVGNGHIGAMVFGRVDEELLQLNENTLYSGEPGMQFTEYNIYKNYEEIVEAAGNGDYRKAHDLIQRDWLGRLHQCYQPLGDLYLNFASKGETKDYYRELDIANSRHTVTYTQNGTKFKREIIASHPDKIIAIRLSADRPEIDVHIRYGGVHPTAYQTVENTTLVLRGQAPGIAQRRTVTQLETWENKYKHPELYDKWGNSIFNTHILYGDQIDGKGTYYESRLQISGDGDKSMDPQNGITITGASEVIIYLTAATSYNGPWESPSRSGIDPSAKASYLLEQATQKTWGTLLHAHMVDYKNLFDRVKIDLYSSRRQLALPTDKRILRYRTECDPQLASLLFQFGRYLMISASREGGQPMNLQGMWNNMVIPPWNCGYTQNINAEMNYWPLEVTGLQECGEPFFRMIRELSESGSQTARKLYRARGWVAHHNSSIWRETYPNDGESTNASWNMAAGWLSSHLWEHYLYSGNTDFLRETAYPIMKGATEFCLDWLIEDENGTLLVPVSSSPENSFFVPGTTVKAAIAPGCTMDMAIIKELFERMIAASEILGCDTELRKELIEKYPKLLPYRIGKRGQLQEWIYDFEEAEPDHRHVSHLYGFHPGNQIIPEHSPELFRAVERTLELRGDEATGWSMGWKINLWARLLDGNHAHVIVSNMFNPVGFAGHPENQGGIYRSMLDAHAPFQIDGNMGFTAGVVEMIMQSHGGYIHLLPAVPDVWKDGSISGIRARGGFILDITWKNGRLVSAKVTSTLGGNLRLKTARAVKVRGTEAKTAEGKNPNSFYSVPGKPHFESISEIEAARVSTDWFYTDIWTEAGKTYEIL